MKSLLLVLALSVTAYSYVIVVPTSPSAGKGIGRFELIFRQKLLLSLFNNVCEKSTNSYIVQKANEFAVDFNEGSYKDPEVLVRFKNLMKTGFLAENEIFSELNKEHYIDFLAIKDILINAKDFDTFFAAAAWVRQNLNCGLYVSVLYSAIIYREDTSKLYIPPPYEILPNYFFQKDAIIAGAFLLSGQDVAFENVRDEGNSYVINVNYTSDMEDDTSDNKLAYFNEDIGINTLIFLKKLMFENLWQAEDSDKLDVAEQIYHLMKQLSTRYELERYSNNIYDSMDINWAEPITDKYDPMLMYSNGKDFSGRTRQMDVSNIEYIEFLKNIENSIFSIVSNMVQNNYTKKDILQTLVETLVTGENSYATIAFRNIGKTIDVTDGTPSSLEHYMTLARDPMFWKVNSKIVTIIEEALRILPTYTRNELYFPGVQINNVDIKKVMTSFDNFVVDATEALKPLSSNVTFQYKIEQPRLNHKAFSIKFNISSVVSQKGLIKIFLAPKLMPGEIAINKNKFMLLDSFEMTFKKGANSVTRSSIEMKSLSDDFLSLKTLEKYVEDAAFGLDTLNFESMRRFTGFPSRLAIPKGSEDGLPFQLFVFVAPLTKVIVINSFSKHIEYNSAALSPGYPLDLFVDDDMLFDLPNALVKEIIITHKKFGSAKSGDFKKPYNKPTSYSNKKDEDDYESWKPEKLTVLKNSGFTDKTEAEEKNKKSLHEKAKFNKIKTPVKILDDEMIFDITNNKSPSYSSNIDVNTFDPYTKENKNVKVDIFDDKTMGKNKVINKSIDDTNTSIDVDNLNKKLIEDTDNSFYMNGKIIKNSIYDEKQIPKILDESQIVDKSFDDNNKNSKDLKMENVSMESDPFYYMNDEAFPKITINNDKTTKSVEKSKFINKSFDDINKTKKYSKDIKMNTDFKYDGKINKSVGVNTDNSYDIKDEIIPKFIINNDKMTKTIDKHKYINPSYDDVKENIKDTKEVIMHKDINDDGSKKITIGDIDVNNKVNPAVEINVGQDKGFVKTINKENNVQKTFDTVDKITDAPSFNVLQISESKDFIKSGDVDVHKKIVIDDHDLTDKNTDISIAKGDGTNVEVHKINDSPVLEKTEVNDKSQPSLYDYLRKINGEVYSDEYEV